MRNILWAFVMIAFAMVPTAARGEKRGRTPFWNTDEQKGVRPLFALTVVIRTYQSDLVSPGDLPSALSVAAGILKAAGLEPQWWVCANEPDQTGADPCAEPPGRNELVIRFLRRPVSRDYAGQAPLGTSLIDTRAGSGSLATIYVDRVTAFARDSGTPAGVLLGRAIAHEIGHLLLGTTAHTRTGLMRAIWSSDALQRSNAADWLFTPNDASAMRDGLVLNQH
jgi:hypothetical protein